MILFTTDAIFALSSSKFGEMSNFFCPWKDRPLYSQSPLLWFMASLPWEIWTRTYYPMNFQFFFSQNYSSNCYKLTSPELVRYSSNYNIQLVEMLDVFFDYGNAIFTFPSKFVAEFRLQSTTIHCSRRGVQTYTPHTWFFSDTFVLVFTPHCDSRCLWRTFTPSAYHPWWHMSVRCCSLSLALILHPSRLLPWSSPIIITLPDNNPAAVMSRNEDRGSLATTTPRTSWEWLDDFSRSLRGFWRFALTVYSGGSQRFEQVRFYPLWHFGVFWPTVFSVFLPHMIFWPFFGPSQLTFHDVKNDGNLKNKRNKYREKEKENKKQETEK